MHLREAAIPKPYIEKTKVYNLPLFNQNEATVEGMLNILTALGDILWPKDMLESYDGYPPIEIVAGDQLTMKVQRSVQDLKAGSQAANAHESFTNCVESIGDFHLRWAHMRSIYYMFYVHSKAKTVASVDPFSGVKTITTTEAEKPLENKGSIRWFGDMIGWKGDSEDCQKFRPCEELLEVVRDGTILAMYKKLVFEEQCIVLGGSDSHENSSADSTGATETSFADLLVQRCDKIFQDLLDVPSYETKGSILRCLLISSFKFFMSGAAVRKTDAIELNVSKIFALHEFAGSPAKNYTIEVLIEQIRIFGDLSSRDAFILLWNRFINATDTPNHSFSLDEFLEGVVRYVKANAKVSSGRVTYENAKIVNDTMFCVQAIQKGHSDYLQSCRTNTSHPDKDFSEKIMKVASLIDENSMLSMEEAKYFSSDFTPNCDVGKERLESSDYLSNFLSKLRPIPYEGVDMRPSSNFSSDDAGVFENIGTSSNIASTPSPERHNDEDSSSQSRESSQGASSSSSCMAASNGEAYNEEDMNMNFPDDYYLIGGSQIEEIELAQQNDK